MKSTQYIDKLDLHSRDVIVVGSGESQKLYKKNCQRLLTKYHVIAINEAVWDYPVDSRFFYDPHFFEKIIKFPKKYNLITRLRIKKHCKRTVELNDNDFDKYIDYYYDKWNVEKINWKYSLVNIIYLLDKYFDCKIYLIGCDFGKAERPSLNETGKIEVLKRKNYKEQLENHEAALISGYNTYNWDLYQCSKKLYDIPYRDINDLI